MGERVEGREREKIRANIVEICFEFLGLYEGPFCRVRASWQGIFEQTSHIFAGI